MKVNDKSSIVLAHQELLKLMIDIEKEQMKPHLLRWHKETSLKYQWRLTNTYFQNFISPTINGISSIVTRKPPLNQDTNINDYLKKDINLTIAQLSKLIMRDGYCLLFPTNYGTSTNRAEDSEVKTIIDIVEKKQVISYRMDSQGKFTQIVIVSEYQKDKGDFDIEVMEQYLVYKTGGGDIYQGKKGSTPSLVDSWTNSLTYIPFAIVGDSMSEETPIKNIAHLNKTHYNLKSGIFNIVNIASNPVPVLYGQLDNTDVSIGVNTPLLFPQKDNMGFEWVEISGSSIEIAEREIKAIEEFILNGTFNLLKDTQYITATEARIQDNKNKSVLGYIVNSIETALDESIEIIKDIAGTSLTPLQLNRDFSDLLLDEGRLKVLLDLRKNGDLSLETLWESLIDGELIEIEDIELEKERLGSERENVI